MARVIHDQILAEFGGPPGTRDPGLLESALSRPQSLIDYGSPPPDIAALAAAYAHGIVRNHPFVDGNKRVAYTVMRSFLLLNRHDLTAPLEQRVLILEALAGSEIDEAALADWLRTNIKFVT